MIVSKDTYKWHKSDVKGDASIHFGVMAGGIMGSLSLLQVRNYTELLVPQVTLQRGPWERILLQPDADRWISIDSIISMGKAPTTGSRTMYCYGLRNDIFSW